MTNLRDQHDDTAADDAWSTYWKKGYLHSCPGAFNANYDDEISVFWTQFFRQLPNNARVLDVGTGNGAIALLARDVAEQGGLTFHIEGIDAAVIQPEEAATRHGLNTHGVTFRSQVAVENTGYPDSSFDVVTSQYAIEYSQTDAALAEISRILKPGGRLAMLLHHTQSVAAQATQIELDAFAYLTQRAPLLPTAHWLIERVLRSADPMTLMHEADSQAQVARFTRLRNDLVSYADSTPGAGFVKGLTFRVSGILQQLPGTGAAHARAELEALQTEMDAHYRRLESMRQACLSSDGLERLRKAAQACGLRWTRCEELYRGGRDLMGWAILAEREGPR